MKQTLQIKTGQQLTITPQLQQAIRLLQLSTIELQQEIKEALESNPLLELVDENSAIEIPADATLREQAKEKDYKQTNNDGLTPNYEKFLKSQITLHDELTAQMDLTLLSDKDKMIAAVIIDSIDDEGYFKTSLKEIQKIIDSDEVEVDEIEAVLHCIQRFDPPGVGATTLQESLSLQLEHFDDETPWVHHARGIVNNSIDLLEKQDHVTLMEQYKLTENELLSTIRLIKSLNPHPGLQISNIEQDYVIPDITVRKHKDQWAVSLSSEIIPRLKIKTEYESLIKRGDTSDDNNFLKSKAQEAKWLINSLKTRDETLLKVAGAIVERQQGFLESGPLAMKPMIMQEIADKLEMHESTISRVTTNKYMHTPHGICELRYFFSSHISSVTGEAYSSTAIREIIKKLIASETSDAPLSDSKIEDFLKQQGINVARRTIAKYRESMSIPPSHERKTTSGK